MAKFILTCSLVFFMCVTSLPGWSQHTVKKEPLHRMVVLPFTPTKGQAFNGTGLSVQFFLSNLAAMHNGLKEFWFGWRIKKIFEDSDSFKAFCHNGKYFPDLAMLAKELKVRYWVHGEFSQIKGKIAVKAVLYDARKNRSYFSKWLVVDLQNNCLDFSHNVLGWLKERGLALDESQAEKAVWPEVSTIKGFDLLGKSLLRYYVTASYKKKPQELEIFIETTYKTPFSFMAWDMLGWAYYRNREYKKAADTFIKALKYNKNGVGALSGLFWSAIKMEKPKDVTKWALAKAQARQEPPNILQATGLYWLGKDAYKNGDFKKAACFFNKAMDLNPNKPSYPYNEAKSWLKNGNPDKALTVLNQALKGNISLDYRKKMETLQKKAISEAP